MTAGASANGHASTGGSCSNNGANLLSKRNATAGFSCIYFAAALRGFRRLAALKECVGDA